MEVYSEYIHKSRYARYLPAQERRETWEETVERYVKEVVKPVLPEKTTAIRKAILNHEVMPSMRALMTAGPALERDNVAGYNCAYVPVDDRRVFDEIMYILMCGTGVGFSVERAYIEKLPVVADEFFDDGSMEIHVADSRIGWATAYRKLISSLYDGFVPTLDYSTIRPAGSRLRTFGGRSSGPEPLRNLFNYTISVFKKAKGRKLNDLEVHDIVCKVAEAIVCGGVRRSALISLSNVTSERLRNAKHGQWYVAEPQRSLANNSVCYTETPDMGLFLKEWRGLIDSKSGERGIFSRPAAISGMPDRRDTDHEFGCNPCSEIILRPRQFCNLTEVIARPTDDYASLKRKVELATILGTIQSTFTDFRYLGKRWRDNCEEERLLGVSLTGIMDCPLLYQEEDVYLDGVYQAVGTLADRLEGLKEHAITTNKTWASRLGITASTAITCVKPSGTVSQLVGSSSGIHPRFSSFYYRRVRADVNDPLTHSLIEQGVPHERDVINPQQEVFTFPIRSPESCITISDASAIDQLTLWKVYNDHWCEHKPSVSIYVKDDEWLKVGAWVYENFDSMSGVSFFPHDNNTYQQAPYESCSEEEYLSSLSTFPTEIDLNIPELEDSTTASQELACAGGACEL
jgi:ribonucleoside-diphosphate reductase alpha chain